ncbi:MAG: translation initiation factor IF-2 [Clostridia bacterium]|nr:translation initiation factor IF-2 [Clostridia bacterium]
MAQQKVKINELAKQMYLKGKDLVDALAEMKIERSISASIEEEEVNLLLEHLTSKQKLDDINPYLAGKITLVVPEAVRVATERAAAAREAEERRIAEEKAAEERRIAEEKAAAVAAEAAERAKEEAAAAERARREAAAREAGKLAREKKEAEERAAREKAQNERYDRGRQTAKTAEKKKDEKGREKNAGRARQTQTFSSTNTSFVEKQQNVRIIDTRMVEIDLSKYDEKYYELSGDSRTEARRRTQQRRQRPGQRPKGGKKSAPVRASLPDLIHLPEMLSPSDLARELRLPTGDILKKLFGLGFRVSINQSIDYATAEIVADEYGVACEPIKVVTIEEKLIDESADTDENLATRPPVVVVMGHVDHGKTSLLDAIRHTSVTTGEAGGITQHIGAYRVKVQDKYITFLDTPGHEAFTAMRARGANITDIAILVVAADDGIMPQTVEAINHAKAANVSIIVAINKMDKPGANADKVMQELTKYDLVPEEWGGDVICVPVSALTKMGIDDLLENVMLMAEMADLKANADREAHGVVVEARLDKGRGPVATMLVKNGTLHTGDVVIAGEAVGRVRAMTDENGRVVKVAGPSTPVEILGLSEVPGAGEHFHAVKDEKMARELAEERRAKQKEEGFKANAKASLDDIFQQIQGGVKDLSLVVKADVQGSAEAVKASLEKLTNEEVRVSVIHAAVGGITENDVMLASASNAIIIGFNVRPDRGAIDSAARQGVDIRTYRVIYECLEEIEAAMKGMLAPTFKEVVLGHAQVRQLIRVPGSGIIAGCYVTDGKITRGASIRVLRDNIVIFEDKLASLKRFKDDVKEVAQNYECGMGLERFNDLKEGDVFEAFVMEEVQA